MKTLQVALLVAGVWLGVAVYHVQIDNLSGYTTPPARGRSSSAPGSFCSRAPSLVSTAGEPPRTTNGRGRTRPAPASAALQPRLGTLHDLLRRRRARLLGCGNGGVRISVRQRDRQAERILIKVGFGVTFAFTLAILLIYDGSRPLKFFDPSPRKSAILVHGNGDARFALQEGFVIVVWGLLAAAAARSSSASS